MMLDILKFIFSNFFIWLGFAIIICGFAPFRITINKGTHVHLDDKELNKNDVKKILEKH